MKKLTSIMAALLGLLSLEFVFGMMSNLYVEFPDTTNQQTLIDASWKHWPLVIHMLLGLVIVVLSIVAMILALRGKQRLATILSVVGLVAVLVAAGAGDRFVRTQEAGWSLTMALGFIVAMGIYGRLMAVGQTPVEPITRT